MTTGERALWIAVFSGQWFASTARKELGHYTDDDRAVSCMAAADRAVLAARRANRAVSEFATEVLG